MTSYFDIVDGARPWQSVLDPSVMSDDLVRAGHQLADAAKVGDWPTVMSVLDNQSKWLVINQWRPGGTAWFTALHQAAWHGAPVDVARDLLDRGALRSLRDAKGRTAYDVAVEHASSPGLQRLLSPRAADRVLGRSRLSTHGSPNSSTDASPAAFSKATYAPFSGTRRLRSSTSCRVNACGSRFPASTASTSSCKTDPSKSRAGAAWSKVPAKLTW